MIIPSMSKSHHLMSTDLFLTLGTPPPLHSGGLAGMSSIVVGQPFDTVKVRLQTVPSFTSTSSVLCAAWSSQEGMFKSLFSGMTPPLLTATAVNAIVFSVYGWSSRRVDYFR